MKLPAILNLLFLIFGLTTFAQTSIQNFAPKPPLGFNSFDSYRSDLTEDRAYALVDVMAKKYLPFGYDYFVMDAGWYTTMNPAKHKGLGLESFGMCVVHPTRFPNGIKALINHAHKKGLKFGVWLMRGIQKEAVKQNLPIPGTKYFSRDIADTTNICGWSGMNYGVDMTKPGAQEYYNVIIDTLASWGIDFIKVDDLVPNPLEIIAIANAIENGKHKMIFSLSPGDVHHPAHMHYYKRANMLRITRDIWDNPLSIEKGFFAWEKFQGISGPGFWPDLDMIPFGRLDLVNKDARQSNFDENQMKTFITQRAMAASPLIIGGDLLTMDDFSYSLLTNREMLACNQNGVMGVNVYRAGNVDVWLTPHKNDPRKGWIGIFNRTTTNRNITLTKQDLGFIAFQESYNLMAALERFRLKDVWSDEIITIDDKYTFRIPAEGVAFFSFQMAGFTPIKKSGEQVSGSPSTVRYIADLTSVFPNPERGWHNRRDVDGRGNNDVRDFSDVRAAGHTLVHSYLRLDDFKETDDIPQSYLDDMQKALDAIRANGLKIILRPTHVWSEIPSVPEARILKHIEQLNAVISKNADVICHLEVGYLGKWGEWHSGRYTDLSNRAEGDTRYRIVKRILDTTPETIPIAMRYPMHIREILDELPVPEGSEPLTREQRDRIGHHSDCFLYDEHDRGTYARLKLWFGNQTLEQQKQYTFDMITSYGGNRMVGGETCSPQIARIEATQIEMALANWTEINIDFWKDAIELWKKNGLPASGNDPAESEFDRISRKFGYRLRLTDASFPMSAKAGGSFAFAANLNNDGYAGIVKSRPIYLVFDNGTDRYNMELTGIDVRTWVSGPIALSLQTVTLPLNMAPGTYKLALWLPDASANLQSRPEYSVRFANNDVWDATKGYNLLTNTLIIK